MHTNDTKYGLKQLITDYHCIVFSLLHAHTSTHTHSLIHVVSSDKVNSPPQAKGPQLKNKISILSKNTHLCFIMFWQKNTLQMFRARHNCIFTFYKSLAFILLKQRSILDTEKHVVYCYWRKAHLHLPGAGCFRWLTGTTPRPGMDLCKKAISVEWARC